MIPGGDAVADFLQELCVRPRLSIGREDNNDLVVIDSRKSRHHAVVEWRLAGFYLTDQSTHGTFLMTGAEAPMSIRRDTVQLIGAGQVSFGRAPKRDRSAIFVCL